VQRGESRTLISSLTGYFILPWTTAGLLIALKRSTGHRLVSLDRRICNQQPRRSELGPRPEVR